MVSLGLASILLAIWTSVWIIAAEAAEEKYQLLHTKSIM